MDSFDLTILKSLPYRVRVSPKGGVGLFALRPIAKGSTLLLMGQGENWDKYLSDEEYVTLPEPVKELISDYCVHVAGEWLLPNDLFNELSPVYFVNHSDEPNLVTEDEGESFQALRDIDTREELTFDYTVYGEDRELGFEAK